MLAQWEWPDMVAPLFSLDDNPSLARRAHQIPSLARRAHQIPSLARRAHQIPSLARRAYVRVGRTQGLTSRIFSWISFTRASALRREPRSYSDRDFFQHSTALSDSF